MRRLNDFYPTPELLTKVLLECVDIDKNSSIFEPCAGDGAIVNCLREAGFVTVDGNDIDDKFDWDFQGDATRRNVWNHLTSAGGGCCDWVIANPPFSSAHLILPLAFEYCAIGVAFLLRLTYLEPAKNRAAWLAEHSPLMSDLIVFGSSRPSFTGGGVDTCTTAWMVWRKERPADGTRVIFASDWKQAAIVNKGET